MDQRIFIHQGATKWDIRQKVWDYIEEKNLANFPRPVHHRIPNFKGAQGACVKLVSLDAFSKTSEVKVDPDKPLEGARLAALQARKTLLVPTPRLRTGLFNKIVPPQNATKEELRVCSTSQGVKEFSVPVGLDARMKVDLVIVGSVAVSEKGYRIGKGEGYADMEYAMMASMGAVNESTVVVTIVHDCQIVDIPEDLIESHDLTVDYILTPTKIIKTECKHHKPLGIIWSKPQTVKSMLADPCPSPKSPLKSTKPSELDHAAMEESALLDAEMLEKIPVLKKLRDLEQKAGKDVTLKVSSPKSAVEEPKSEPQPDPKRQHAVLAVDGDERLKEMNAESERSQGSVSTLYLGGIPAGLRVSELKSALRERGLVPLRLTWQGAQHRAFLVYSDGPAADRALASLQGLSINGHTLQAEHAKSQRGSHRPGQVLQRPKNKAAKGTTHTTMATATNVGTA